MAKTIKIEVVSGCIHYGDGAYLPGKIFDCDIKEAKRLKDLGVACDPLEKSDTDPGQSEKPATDQEKLDLLAAIATAETTEALTSLMPEAEPDEEIQAAFTTRMAELEQ